MVLSWNTIIILAFIATFVYYYCTRNFNYWKDRGVPYKKPMFLFGNIIHLMKECVTPGKSMAKFYNMFDGPYFGFFSFNNPQLVLKDPQLIRDVFIKDFQLFPNRPVYSNEKIDPIASNSLPIIRQPHWRLLRAKLSPVFTSGKMKMMFHLMDDCGKNLKSYIDTIVGKDDLEVKELAAKYTTDVIATCAFGIDANSFVNENSEFRVAGKRIFERGTLIRSLQAMCYLFAPIIVKIFRFPIFEPEAVNFLRGVFNETIRQRETLKNKRNDLIDILIELKNQETKDDEYKFNGDRLVSQAVVFFGAGHETTSSTIAFALHELCVNEDIQKRLRKDIVNAIERHGSLTYDAVQDMKYLHMLVTETLRKYPLTPLLQRQCEADYTFSTGLKIEKGTTILISQHGLHWDSKYFPNPERFDPERFNEENKHKIPSYVYLPFGDGPRNCIGERFALLSSKLGIIHIIKNFRVERNYLTHEPIEYDRSPHLRSKNGIRLTFWPLQ